MQSAEFLCNNAAGDVLAFDEFGSEMASRVNPDGTTSFLTVVPGLNSFEFVVWNRSDKRTLTLRDAQREYLYREK